MGAKPVLAPIPALPVEASVTAPAWYSYFAMLAIDVAALSIVLLSKVMRTGSPRQDLPPEIPVKRSETAVITRLPPIPVLQTFALARLSYTPARKTAGKPCRTGTAREEA